MFFTEGHFLFLLIERETTWAQGGNAETQATTESQRLPLICNYPKQVSASFHGINMEEI